MRQPTAGTRMSSVLVAATLLVSPMAGLAPIARAGARAAPRRRRPQASDDGDGGPPGRVARPSRVKTATPPPAATARSSAAKKAMPRSAGNGAVVTGEEVDVQGGAVGRRGAVVVGEEGAAAVGRYGGVVVGNRYESYDAWRAVAAVGTGIAIGTMLAKPPAAATTVVVSGSTYYYHDNAYYTRVMNGGACRYQVVAPPAGAIITTLPANCQSVQVGNATYSQCGPTYYTRVSNGYQVVVLQ